MLGHRFALLLLVSSIFCFNSIGIYNPEVRPLTQMMAKGLRLMMHLNCLVCAGQLDLYISPRIYSHNVEECRPDWTIPNAQERSHDWKKKSLFNYTTRSLYKLPVKVALSLSSCIVLLKCKLLKQLKNTYDALNKVSSHSHHSDLLIWLVSLLLSCPGHDPLATWEATKSPRSGRRKHKFTLGLVSITSCLNVIIHEIVIIIINSPQGEKYFSKNYKN